jgi:hypothetical protein
VFGEELSQRENHHHLTVSWFWLKVCHPCARPVSAFPLFPKRLAVKAGLKNKSKKLLTWMGMPVEVDTISHDGNINIWCIVSGNRATAQPRNRAISGNPVAFSTFPPLVPQNFSTG